MINTQPRPIDVNKNPFTEPEPQSPPSRLIWVDGLRTVMILLVVNMHSCVTYSHIGSWYFMISPEPTLAEKIPYAFWQGHLQAFFMGLLFFISGYFADRSRARKTASQFLGERFRRLGIPTLVYMLLIHPLIVFGLLSPAAERPSLTWFLTNYIGKGRFLGDSGPMWFAFALLLFCVPFAFIGRGGEQQSATKPFVLKPWAVLGLGVGLGLGSFLVRTLQPVGTSILNFQFCYFTQYIVVFILGVVVSRKNALASIAQSKVAWRAGWCAFILGPVALATFAALAASDMARKPPPMTGGWNWEALALALWEQCAGVGLGLGAMALATRFLNRDRPAMRWLSDRSFGIYLIHAPILVALALAFQKFHANIYLMTVILTVTGCALSAVLAGWLRKIPVLKTIL